MADNIDRAVGECFTFFFFEDKGSVLPANPRRPSSPPLPCLGIHGGEPEKVKQPPLPVSMEDTKKKISSSKRVPPFPAVNFACLWALLTAGAMAGTSVYNLAHQSDPAPAEPAIPSPRMTSIKLTGTAAVEASTIQGGQLWCSAPQAAAAATALLLPSARRHRSRRAMAFVALAATAANHYMYARLLGFLFVPAPGNATLAVETVAVFVAGVFDVLCFLDLLLIGEDDEDTEPEE